jgi:hypothetical protein
MKYFTYKTFLAIYVVSVLFSACTNSGAEKQAITVEKKDTLIIHDEELRRTAALFKEGTLPFTADTALLYHLIKYDSLGTKEVQALAKQWFKHDLVSVVNYEFTDFYKIDSIKATGHYAKWCETLDIGMTKFANAYAVCKLKIDSTTYALVWAMHTSSYEACPYSIVYTTYFTLIHKGDVGETFVLGQYMSAADAPASMERTINGALLANGTFNLMFKETQDEGDSLPEVMLTKEQYNFAIQGGVIKVLSEKKESTQKVKREGPASN